MIIADVTCISQRGVDVSLHLRSTIATFGLEFETGYYLTLTINLLVSIIFKVSFLGQLRAFRHVIIQGTSFFHG